MSLCTSALPDPSSVATARSPAATPCSLHRAALGFRRRGRISCGRWHNPARALAAASRFQLLHVDGPGSGRNFHARRGLVDQVDGLVGQEAAGDVAVGKLRRGDDRLVGDRHLVMRLQGIAQATENHDRLRNRRLRHEHRLEAPLQCRVLLDVFLVLVQRRRADRFSSPRASAGLKRWQCRVLPRRRPGRRRRWCGSRR